MTNSVARLALVLTLAALGAACRPSAAPLPMLSAGHGAAHTSEGSARQ